MQRYEILIYAGENTLAALDISESGLSPVSMSGNTTHSANDAEGFYENLLDYYNVDDLSEIEADVRIINGEADNRILEYLTGKFLKLKKFSLLRAEEAIPLILLNKKLINKSSVLCVNLYDRGYIVETDDKFDFSVISVSAEDGGYHQLDLKDFVLLNHFNGKNLNSDSEELKKVKEELDIQKTQIAKLNKRLVIFPIQPINYVGGDYSIRIKKLLTTDSENTAFTVGGEAVIISVIEFAEKKSKFEYSYTAQVSGKVFYLFDNEIDYLTSQPLAVISSEDDTREEIDKWLKENGYTQSLQQSISNAVSNAVESALKHFKKSFFS